MDQGVKGDIMSESFIRNLRIASVVLMVAGLLMGSGLALSIAYFAFILSMSIPYFRIERLYWALMRRPDAKEKIDQIMREDREARLGVNKDDKEERPDDDSKEG